MGRFDSISLYGGNCEYYCVWDRFDDGRPCCIFALRIYNWERIGKTEHLPLIGCVGVYGSSAGRPKDASAANGIDTRQVVYETLDPFGR